MADLPVETPAAPRAADAARAPAPAPAPAGDAAARAESPPPVPVVALEGAASPLASPQRANAPSSPFGAWRLDRLHLGSLFAAPDAVEPSSPPPPDGADAAQPQEARSVRTPDLKATAANLAHAASAELAHASEAAQHTFGKAAQELGKGWGTLNSFLDDMLAPAHGGGGGGARALGDEQSQRVLEQFDKHFPQLDRHDQVVDHFECALIQKYRCHLNNATPEKVFPLRGTLFVTTTHIAMHVVDEHAVFSRTPFGITVPFSDVAKIQKGAKSMLRVLTVHNASYIFAQFDSDTHFNGALSLLDHMKAAPQTPSDSAVERAPPSAADAGADSAATTT
ncbi:hypothetical protein FGB62_12g132 [Gracilaria domingensis]|nr:hypothetical protein FGB62_12g132 [Gracilaria domingensis]